MRPRITVITLTADKPALAPACGRWSRWLVALLVVGACSGCVVVPVGAFTQPPFPPELLDRLSSAQADRTLARQQLGNPTAHKARGQYWFYARSRATWGVIGGTSSTVFTDDEWLAVEFDKAGRIVYLEHSKDPDDCLSNGICILAGLFSTQPSRAIMTAPRLQDQATRNYRAGPEECAIYFFLESLPWLYKFVTARFSVDGQALGTINDKAYLFTTHPRADIRISAYQLTTHARCEGGKTLYVKAVKALDNAWDTGKALTLVSEAEAAAALQARQLALPD